MSFNGSFGDGEFVDEEDNSNITSLQQEDIKINFDERTKSKFSINKSINNTSNDVTINSNTNNNIFNTLFPEIKINFQYNNSDNNYYSLLSKELLKYHLSNLFNILKSKITIINIQTFYLLKRSSSININNLINAEILYLKISGNLYRLSNIFQKKRRIILFQAFYSMKTKLCNFKKDKDKIKNENNSNNICQLKNDIKNIEFKIENLTNKENKLKMEINDIINKERQLSHNINKTPNSNNILEEYIQISNISKQLEEGKEEIIKVFMEQVNSLITEYQEYIDNINKNDDEIKNNNIIMSHKDESEDIIY